MSFKRHMRRHLRVVREEETAFRELMGLIGTYVALGVPPQAMSQGFLPVQGKENVSMPVLLIRGFLPGNEEKELSYRLNDYEVNFVPEECERRWRAWSVERFTSVPLRETNQLALLSEFHRASSFSSPKMMLNLMGYLRQAGIRLPEPKPPEQDTPPI